MAAARSRPTRDAMLDSLVRDILMLPDGDIRRVAVDGVDGAGKTYLADELAARVETEGVPVIRASVDGFHNPPDVRYARGRRSPEGYFRDSYDYPRMIAPVSYTHLTLPTKRIV